MNQRKQGARGARSVRLFSMLLGLAAIAVSTSGVPAALAGGSPPVAVSFSVDLPAEFAAPGACFFPVRIEAAGKGGTIELPGDRLILTSPGVSAVITNLENPAKSVNLVITGAFHVSTEPNGDQVTVVTGRNLLGDPFAGFVLAIGTFSYTLDSAQNLVQSLEGKGKLVDICDLID